MRKDTIFKLGDRVYAPFHGYGVVTAIHEDACVYPIEVTWNDSGLKNMEDVNTFTADGLLSKYYANTDTILTVVKGSHKRNRRKEMSASKFKVGDRVYNPSHGYGVVAEIKDDGREYPIVVTWDEKKHGCISIFTPEGFAIKGFNCDDTDLTLVEKASLKGEKEMEEDSKFQVGDRVWVTNFEQGVIIRFCPNKETCIVNIDNFNQEVEMRIDDLEKVEYTAVNPSHYRVEGIPEAYDIMTHLMNREQLEGFLWGNIIKYAYRYGRKGDEAETAGKIKWYAQKLKELRGV